LTSKRYEGIKARKEADPGFRAALHASQAESRRRKIAARHAEAVTKGLACPYPLVDRHCWKRGIHQHAGVTIDSKTGQPT
jgi:hypothetical protein